ncbi:putative membrane protein [Salinisphaera sp. T31B1]
MTLPIGYAVSSLIPVALFLIAFVAQLRAQTFHPALYWIVILATSSAGTTLSQLMNRTVGLG